MAFGSGRTYVTVQAEPANRISTYAAGSQGETDVSSTIKWMIPGGITGQYGWKDKDGNPLFVNDESPKDDISAAVAIGWSGATFIQLQKISNCVE